VDAVQDGLDDLVGHGFGVAVSGCSPLVGPVEGAEEDSNGVCDVDGAVDLLGDAVGEGGVEELLVSVA
jgi:hypothetical protein